VIKTDKLNVGLNHLSRLEIGEEPTNLDENLLDLQLFSVSREDSYFEDVIEFLSIGLVPPEYIVA